MTDIPQEAVAATKLTRADAVKMVATEIAEQCSDDANRWGVAVQDACTKFRAYMIAAARIAYIKLLDEVTRSLGTADILGACEYRVYQDGTDSGDVARVVFSDHQQTFEARFRIGVDLKLDGIAKVLRDDWKCALGCLKAAHERDMRVGAMKKEAREALIKAALADTVPGDAVVVAIKALAKYLKAKI